MIKSEEILNMYRYIRPQLLIVDEIGYLPGDKQTATKFFNLVAKRYKRSAIILASQQGGYFRHFYLVLTEST